ncbi:MAG: hypothetical protein O3B13_25320 [Planctomycetota bacterium]|nr:hypothetical protein [Planctomycetota bacterium]
MDPQATLRELLEALEQSNWDAVLELSQALLTWIQHEGFPPVILGSESLGPEWHRQITNSVCRAALLRAKAARKKSRSVGDSA